MMSISWHSEDNLLLTAACTCTTADRQMAKPDPNKRESPDKKLPLSNRELEEDVE